MLETFRSDPRMTSQLDRALIGRIEELHRTLLEAQGSLRQLKAVADRALAAPWYPAVFEQFVNMPGEPPRGVVYQCGTRSVVTLMETVPKDSLNAGDEVFLGSERNVVVHKSPLVPPRVGETARFDRQTEDGHMIATLRDEQLVFKPVGELRDSELEPGDLIRCDRSNWLATERIEHSRGRKFLLGEIPDAYPEQVGGDRGHLEALLGALTTRLVAPKKAAEYGVTGRQSILLEGPPGVGKTLSVRVAVAEAGRIRGKSARLAVVKPTEWEDPYVGVTQQNIRACFRELNRAAAEHGLAVLFLDEIETIGRIRGSAVGFHSDKFLGALLAEIDGFVDREGVAIIAATNRKDLCDPALLERFDVEISVPRPDMRSARSILEVHLPETAPYYSNGQDSTATRREMIDHAVSRLYSPNGDNQLCTLKFRDGKIRTVAARELMSGRAIQQVCGNAKRLAFLRDVEQGESGMRIHDIDEAISREFSRLSTTLDRGNVHAYLSDLPQDVDVVAVEPVARRVGNGHRYLNRRRVSP
ncbi:MAG: AAA family ATPase [Planctomycetaceae bacterium]|nr:AAA family ATPase [Planctomycetaceae bacterium]